MTRGLSGRNKSRRLKDTVFHSASAGMIGILPPIIQKAARMGRFLPLLFAETSAKNGRLKGGRLNCGI
ncbi:hypothetical protein [Yanshouia hominis]|uniref:Uncharacterized protein n=1 Tax=Yanshouia hominis TaxID=2763673 RepID=A0ABR7NF42_9FIRM|nr:hypothetical protein [Yanshouia hominis]MBC8575018.1 hypothetical protein [Yanshouia hominis]